MHGSVVLHVLRMCLFVCFSFLVGNLLVLILPVVHYGIHIACQKQILQHVHVRIYNILKSIPCSTCPSHPLSQGVRRGHQRTQPSKTEVQQMQKRAGVRMSYIYIQCVYMIPISYGLATRSISSVVALIFLQIPQGHEPPRCISGLCTCMCRQNFTYHTCQSLLARLRNRDVTTMHISPSGQFPVQFDPITSSKSMKKVQNVMVHVGRCTYSQSQNVLGLDALWSLSCLLAGGQANEEN